LLIQTPNNNIKRERSYPNERELQSARIILIIGILLMIVSVLIWVILSPLGSFITHLTLFEWFIAVFIGSIIFSLSIFLDDIGSLLYSTFKLKQQSTIFLKPQLLTFIHIYWYVSLFFIAGTSYLMAGELNTYFIILLTLLFFPIFLGRYAFRSKRVRDWFYGRMNFFEKLQSAQDNLLEVLKGVSTPNTNSGYFKKGYFDFDVNILRNNDFKWLLSQIKNNNFDKNTRYYIAQTIYPDDPQRVSVLMRSSVN
jgi:hypothetical protein